MKKTIVPFFSVLICLFVLIACAPKQVENKEVEVLLNGISTKCLYTGAYLLKPSGIGEYRFTSEDEEWVFVGEAGEKSELIDGSVEDMPYSFKHDGDKYETLYTGEVENLQPTEAIYIKDYPFTLQFDGKQYEGVYSGYLAGDLPDGKGEFSYEDKGDYFEYTGEWKTGELVGKGSIDSNCFVIHFPEVNREGEYLGEVENGLPKGEGKFTAVNAENTSYVYDGQWEAGLYDGQGKLVYDSENFYVREGKFTQSEFTPSVIDFYKCLGTSKDEKFEYSDAEIDFINNHQSMFTGQIKEIDDSFIDTSFKYELFSKDESKFDNSIIKVSGLRVVQIYEEELWGYDHVFLIAEDSRYRVYYINMIGSSSDIVEGSRIELVGMPVDYFTYHNVAGTDIWAISCVGIMITKK